MKILRLDDFRVHHAEFTGAFQTGPGLVENGEIAVSPRDQLYTRSWLALCENQVLAGITLEPVSLFSLAAFIVDAELNGGFRCQNAVNLAGGGSEALVLKTDNGTISSFGNERARQASYIVFR